MKRIVIFILLAFSITFANAQKPRESSDFVKFNLRPIESVFDVQSRKVDAETNVLRIQQNQNFRTDSKDAREIAWYYLQANGHLYGIRSILYNIEMVRSLRSPAGEYFYFRQYINGIPVYATNFIVFVNNDNAVMYSLNEFRNITGYRNISNRSFVTNNDALKIAHEHLNIRENIIREPQMELVYFESIDKGLELAWKINTGAWRVFVSAETGRIIQVTEAGVPAAGGGRVFAVNPLVSAGVSYGQSCFAHNGGANNPCLESQLVHVTLRDLTFENDVFKLRGPFVVIEHIENFDHNIPVSETGLFHFTRNQEEFASVMAYYHIDLSARRILELGLQMPAGLKQLRVYPHGEPGVRNAAYRFANYITFGSGGGHFVNAAEDADVIWHEHGHAIQANLGAGFNHTLWLEQKQTAAVGEGSADYWATSYKRSLFPNNWEAFALWFDMNNPVISRRADLNWVYPADFYPTPCHHLRRFCPWCAGQIWSSALMRIWGDLGRDITDRLFLETHLIWGEAPTMRSATASFMQADVHLHNGIHLCQITARFQEHGLVSYPININGLVLTNSFTNQTVTANREVVGCRDLVVRDVIVSNGATLTLIAPGNIYISNITIAENARLILSAGNDIIIDGYLDVHLGAEFEIR